MLLGYDIIALLFPFISDLYFYFRQFPFSFLARALTERFMVISSFFRRQLQNPSPRSTEHVQFRGWKDIEYHSMEVSGDQKSKNNPGEPWNCPVLTEPPGAGDEEEPKPLATPTSTRIESCILPFIWNIQSSQRGQKYMRSVDGLKEWITPANTGFFGSDDPCCKNQLWQRLTCFVNMLKDCGAWVLKYVLWSINLMAFRVDMETNFWVCVQGIVSQLGNKGRKTYLKGEWYHFMWVGGEFQPKYKGDMDLTTKIHCSVFSEHGSNVIICSLLLLLSGLPYHSSLHPPGNLGDEKAPF